MSSSKLETKQCGLKSEQMDIDDLLITEEDADPFALTPKVEDDADEVSDGDIGPQSDTMDITTTTENVTINSTPSCLICNSQSKHWPKKFANQVQSLAESLCKLFSIPNIPYENDFARVKYCVQCQKNIMKISKVLQQLERLQKFIIEARVDIESQFCESTNVKLSTALTTISEEQKEINRIRRKIVTKLGLSTVDRDTELQSDQTRDEELNLRIDSVDSINDVGIASELKVEAFFAQESDPEWDPEIGPGDTEAVPDPEDSDSDYEPPCKRQTRNSSRRSVRHRKRTSGKQGDSVAASVPSESETKILVVQLERLQPQSGPASNKKVKYKKKKLTRNRNNTRTSQSVKDPEDDNSLGAIHPSKYPRYKGVKGDLDFHCDLCNFRFISHEKLDIHKKRKHEGVKKPFQCDYPGCSKVFKWQNILDIHKMHHTKEKPVICDYCGRRFKTEVLLKLHQQNKHIDGGRKFKCNQCERTFVNQQRLTFHTATHTKVYPFICESCGQGYNQKSHLEAHIVTKHSGDNPFKCEFENCGKTFCSRLSLNLHTSTHTGTYPLYCDVCGIGSYNQSSLNRHKLKHEEEKTYSCTLCPNKFTYSQSLTKHMMAHQGIKRFQCDTCEKSFIDSYKLQRHKKIHTGERPFQCLVCQKCFYTKDYLATHMNNHPTQKSGVTGTIAATKPTQKRRKSQRKITRNDYENPTESDSNQQEQESSIVTEVLNQPSHYSTLQAVPTSVEQGHNTVLFQGEFFKVL